MVPSNVYNLQHTFKVSKMERIKMTCDKQNMIPLFKRWPIDQCCCSGSLEFIVAPISVWCSGCLSPRINFRELNDPVLISPQQRAYFTMIVGIGAWKPLQLKPVVFRKSSLVYDYITVQWLASCIRPGKVQCTWIGQRVWPYQMLECSSDCLPSWWLSYPLRSILMKWDTFPNHWTY